MPRLISGSLGVLLSLLVVVPLLGQPFPVPIAQAIALLTSGTTPFEIVGILEDGYINFGDDREATGYGLRDNAGNIEFKNEGGSWTVLPTSGLAPTTATYITQTPNAGLSAEQALSLLGSALLVNTTATGVVSAYAGTTCVSEVLVALNALGAGTCDPVTLTTMVTGTLPVANGGSGAATVTGTLIGNGTSAFTAATSSTGGQVLRVTGANTFAYGAVDLDDTDAITGTLAVANGGTNLASGTSGGVLGYTASGTLASSVALTANNLVLGAGAGATPIPLGSLGSTTTFLRGNAAGAPTFSQVALSTDTTGTLGETRGGTNQTTYTTGDILYASASNTLSKLAAVGAGSFLRAAGTTTAPAWSTTIWPNSATAGDLIHASGSNTYANLAAAAAGKYLRAAGVATPSVWSTLTLPNTATTGDLLHASATNTVTSLAAVAVGRVLSSAGTSTAPVWSTDPTATTFTASTALQVGTTIAAAGAVRLTNTAEIRGRNAGDTNDITLIGSTSGDRVFLGNAQSTGLTYTDGTRSLFWQTQAPTISAGFGAGGPEAIAGSASAFKVTVGTGGDTSGVVLFNVTYTNAPVCLAQNQTTSQAVRPTPTTTQVTLTGTLAESDILAVYCVGY